MNDKANERSTGNKGVVHSTGYALSDAKKGRLSMKGQALLQWGWDGQFYSHSIQMPENVVDEILAGRDLLHNTPDQAQR